MIGANLFQPMDKLSRKELQALCKSNGIPANKSNAFMMEALTKKRVPLSQMDSNRDQKVDSSIRSILKSPPVARKSVSSVNSLGPTQKPPVFTNNFLRRGRRKDPPTSNEIEPEKQKVPRTNVASGLRKSSTDVLTRSGAPLRKKEADSSNATKEAKMITSGVTSSNTFTNPSKGNIEERVRSQIDAALCSVQLSKVMKIPERRLSAATSSESSELAVDSNVKLGRGEALNLPLEHSEQQRGNGHVKEEDMQSECSKQQMDSLSLPEAPANQIRTQESVSTSTPAVPRSTSLALIAASPPVSFSPSVRRLEEKVRPAIPRSTSSALIAASPPVSFSPLVRRLEEKVHSIEDRIHNFWKDREWAVVNNFSSPVQQV